MGDGFTATYNAQDEMTSSAGSGGTTRYNYSLRGTLDSTVTPDGSTATNTFDAYDELTASGSRTYSYDALGRVATAGGQGAAATFSYDGPSAEPVSDGSQTFGRTPMGSPVSVNGGGGSGSLVTDDHGDVVETLGSSGVTGATGFAPFGAPHRTGAARPALGFQGGWTDPVTGNVMTASRWYSPVLSRFLSADTQQNVPTPAVNANRYVYGNDDPLDRTDRSGHGACEDYERDAVERAEARKEEEQALQQLRQDHIDQVRSEQRAAREDELEREEERAREERAGEREERALDEEEFEDEHNGETPEEYRDDLERHAHDSSAAEDRPWWEDALDAGEEVLEDGAELAAEDPELLLLLESYTNPSLGDCGSGAEPERVTPKNTEQQARQGVEREVDNPDAAPPEDPAAKAASEPKSYHPQESEDGATSQTTQDAEPARDADPAGDASDEGPVVRYNRRSQYGGAQTNGRVGQGIREEAEGAGCPSCGEPMISGTETQPVPEHSPSLLEHYYEEGGYAMTDSERAAYARSADAFDGARCLACQRVQGGQLSRLSRYYLELFGLNP